MAKLTSVAIRHGGETVRAGMPSSNGAIGEARRVAVTAVAGTGTGGVPRRSGTAVIPIGDGIGDQLAVAVLEVVRVIAGRTVVTPNVRTGLVRGVEGGAGMSAVTIRWALGIEHDTTGPLVANRAGVAAVLRVNASRGTCGAAVVFVVEAVVFLGQRLFGGVEGLRRVRIVRRHVVAGDHGQQTKQDKSQVKHFVV